MASLSMSLHCILFTFLVSMSLAFKELLKYEGMDCRGSIDDILRDFEGNEDQCKAKCQELGNECVGFTRVKSGSSAYVGKCYFRGGSLETPTTNSERDCFESYPGLFARNAGMTCTGTDDDILRDYTGTADECKAMCSSLEECAGFVRVNSGSGHAGKCFFRGGHLSDPSSYTADDRDCYVPTAFQKYTASNCAGSSTDILRDYEGSALACKEKCLTLDGCVGFVRVNSGTYAGKCYFRGGSLNPPEPYSNDDRDCYVPASLMDFNEYEDSQCTGSSGDHTDDILRDFAGTVDECKDKCVSLDGCVGFVEVDGLCYFRGGVLSAPTDYDGRSCFEPFVVIPVPAGKSVQSKEIGYGERVEITAKAVFKSTESGVEGEVIVDENGNVFIDLDVSKLDSSKCEVDDKEAIVFEYAIYSKWDYGKADKESKYGDECGLDVSGEEYNPYDVPSCSQFESGEDLYFACSMGDLSGRFGVAEPDEYNRIVIEGNISEESGDKEAGFCASRLTPESLHQRSIVFRCKDSKSTYLFCAPFQIEKVDA
eukprot:167794_1